MNGLERVIQYKVENPPAGQKVSGYLKEKGYSNQNLVNLKKDPESIYVNGVCTRQNYVLKHGDELQVHIKENQSSEQIIPVELPISIVYEDEDIMVINKPAGMPIHPSRNNFDNSLGNALAWLYENRGETFVFRCINRLDRDTSGLTVVAKHMVSSAILSMMVAQKAKYEMKREYLAITEGTLEHLSGTIDAPIARKESEHLERIVDFHTGDRAVTHYRVVEQYENHSLVALQLETGRTHQIRVHMQYIGHPLVGDFLYNPDWKEDGILTRQALHAHKLEFIHPITGEPMHFEAPVPLDMQQYLKSIGKSL